MNVYNLFWVALRLRYCKVVIKVRSGQLSGLDHFRSLGTAAHIVFISSYISPSWSHRLETICVTVFRYEFYESLLNHDVLWVIVVFILAKNCLVLTFVWAEDPLFSTLRFSVTSVWFVWMFISNPSCCLSAWLAISIRGIWKCKMGCMETIAALSHLKLFLLALASKMLKSNKAVYRKPCVCAGNTVCKFFFTVRFLTNWCTHF